MKEKEEKKKIRLQQAFNFFANNSLHIEILRNNNLDLIFFIKLPYCHCLPKEKKTEFHENVDRNNSKSKVTALM